MMSIYTELPWAVDALQKDPSNEDLQEQIYVLRAKLQAFDESKDWLDAYRETSYVEWGQLLDEYERWQKMLDLSLSLKDQPELCEESRAWWKMRYIQSNFRVKHIASLLMCRYCKDTLTEKNDGGFCSDECWIAHDRELYTQY